MRAMLLSKPGAGAAADKPLRRPRTQARPREILLSSSSMSGTRRDATLDRELIDAAFVCDLVRVRDLLARGAHPDARDEEEGRTPIFSAVLGGSLALLGLLIEAKADVNAR